MEKSRTRPVSSEVHPRERGDKVSFPQKIKQAIETYGFLFFLSFTGVVSAAGLTDALIYKFFRIEHISLMHEIVSFTAVAVLFISFFGAMSVAERKNLDPLGTAPVKKPIISFYDESLVQKKKLMTYVFIGVSGVLYFIFSNMVVTLFESLWVYIYPA